MSTPDSEIRLVLKRQKKMHGKNATWTSWPRVEFYPKTNGFSTPKGSGQIFQLNLNVSGILGKFPYFSPPFGVTNRRNRSL